MDLNLDSLLNIADTTVDRMTKEEHQITLKLRFLHEKATCPHCNQISEELHQNRPILIRDLSIFGKNVYLETPRRQFYCQHCQRYFTERLTFADWERRYTQRYEEYIYERVQSTSIEQVRRDESLSWDQVQGIFKRQFELKKRIIGKEQNGSALMK